MNIANLQNAEKKFIENLRISYYRRYEWKEIKRKESLYHDIQWSQQQMSAFDNYWQNALGRKIPDNWHRLYQSYNGIFRADYVPEMFYSTYIEPKMNDSAYGRIFSNKALFNLLYTDPSIEIPRIVASSDGIAYYDDQRQVIQYDLFCKLIGNSGQVVLKPASGYGSGQGIKFADFRNMVDHSSNKSVQEILKSMVTKEYIVQELVHQHETLSDLNRTSVNTIRIMTYIYNNQVFHTPIVIRFGCGTSRVDNIHAGGLAIAVNEQGSLGNTAYKLGYADECERFVTNPVTGKTFSEMKIPFMKNVIQAAYRLHGRTPHIGIVGWDFSLNEEGKPILIEANFHGTGVWLPQICHGESLFRTNTENIIKKYMISTGRD